VKKNISSRTTLAKKLIFYRKKRGLTQEALSKISGVSRRTIAFYETKNAKPSFENIDKLAKGLNISMEELTGIIKTQSFVNNKGLDFLSIDSRTINRIKQILDLTSEQRHMVYAFIDSLKIKNR
jgi:transcriptional regulator with XRE-family HTH domain